MNKKFLFFILIIILPLAFLGASCGKEDLTKKKATLVFWGVFDDSDAFKPLIEDFKAVFPNVKIEYRKKTIEDYEEDLVDALAEGRAPDIFMIHHTWMAKHAAKLLPMPETLMTVKDYQETFVDVASQDFITEGGIYSLPLYTDTMALFYNKDLFNNAGVSSPPATWDEFQDTVKKLTKIDQFGNIVEAGAAIGTAKNVNRSTDILASIMIQNGSQMSSKTEPLFGDRAGQDALRFYTEFSNQLKKAYTWNSLEHYSLDAFSEREVAMMFNYAYQYNTLKAKDPRFNFDVAPFPQIKGTSVKSTYANYWSPAVSYTSPNGDLAWEFLKFISGREEAEKYLNIAKRPAARRDIIEKQKNDPDLGVFAEQSLTAQSWYRVDSTEIDKIFADMIENVVAGNASVQKAASEASDKVKVLMNK